MKLKSFLRKSSGLFNCLALLLVVQGANTACAWIVHQPEFPEEAECFKKVK